MRDFHMPGRSAVYATNGMCATSHPLAAKTAIDILQSGGNAVDAAIAASILLGVCEPAMTGIGGDCFVLVKPAGTDGIIAINGSGRAPSALNSADLRAGGHSVIDPNAATSVTLPGAIDAFCRLSESHGRKGLDAILAPAIAAFEDGVPVAPRAAFDWNEAQARLQGIARNQYLNNGQPFRSGQKFALPGQAEVLRRIAKDGRAAFYEGEVMDDMLSSINALGGVHTAGDFASVKATPTTPISGTYGGFELVEHPPNGQGATALLLANILSHFDISLMEPFGAMRAHIEAEASKLAYDTRDRFLADPDHMTKLDHMLSMDTARALAELIDPNKAMPSARTRSENVHKDTIYLTVMDRDGMTVSLIYSIFNSFGSGLSSDKFGILFQNRGSGFTLEAGHANEAAGGKRPMHTIIPAMLRHDGKTVMSFGVMGGAYQPNGHVRVLSNMLDYGMELQSALDAPRSFADLGQLKVERGYAPEVHAELAEMGHDVIVPDTPIGGAQAIWIDTENGVLIGASDPRKDGCALGY